MDTLQLGPVDVALGNDFEVNVILEKPSHVAGERFRMVPDSGLGSLVVAFFSLGNTPAAAAIHAGLTVTCFEIGATGTYSGSIGGAFITQQLGQYVGTPTPVYLLVTDGTSLRCYARCRIVASRPVRVA